MKTKLFLLKTNVLKFTQQKFERKNQRNKHFNKIFTNVQYASPWIHGTHQKTVFQFLPNSNNHIGIDGYQGLGYPSLQIIH